MTNNSNDNLSTLNTLTTIQNESICISATCDTIIDAIFNLANRQGEEFHTETMEKIIMQLHSLKLDAENVIIKARLGEYKSSLNE